jgi:hypothetical protein
VQRNIESLADVYGGAASTLTGYAISTNNSWPYVTYPNWERFSSHIQELTTTVEVALIPMVDDANTWASYAVKNAPYAIAPIVFEIDNGLLVPVQEDEQSAVVWQFAADPDYANGFEPLYINFNAYCQPFFHNAAMAVRKFGLGIPTGFMPPIDYNMEGATGTSLDVMAVDKDVRSAYIHPIYDDFSPNASVVAYLHGSLSWKAYFDHVPSTRDHGVHCVISNSCGQQHTWLVSTNKVTYEGKVR